MNFLNEDDVIAQTIYKQKTIMNFLNEDDVITQNNLQTEKTITNFMY